VIPNSAVVMGLRTCPSHDVGRNSNVLDAVLLRAVRTVAKRQTADWHQMVSRAQ